MRIPELDGFIKKFLNSTVSGCNINFAALSTDTTTIILRYPGLFPKVHEIHQDKQIC